MNNNNLHKRNFTDLTSLGNNYETKKINKQKFSLIELLPAVD